MEIRVSNIEAAKTLDELLDRVTSGGETVVIEREGKPAVQLVPAKKPDATIADLVELLRSWEPLNDGWAEGVEEAIRMGNQPQEDPWER
jgi:antitoxin (DNA-binding transcriptional repressor) of toxin-antitoxin stability system